MEKLFGLEAGEFQRLVPFFGFYALLFLSLTLADGLSLALFLQQVGPESLPGCYAMTAVFNLVCVGIYLKGIDRWSGTRMFQAILSLLGLLYLSTWLAAALPYWNQRGYALLFIGRETGFTLVLMHFGTYLQEYFTRAQMNRVLPLIYAGGRLGGIGGGLALEWLSAPLGVFQLLPVFSALMAVCGAMLVAISLRCPRITSDGNDLLTGEISAEDEREHPGAGAAAATVSGFLKFVRSNSLMFWTSVTAVVFVGCRWTLNFQYSLGFATHFPDAESLAGFVGRYNQFALMAALLLQLFVVGRLIERWGLKRTQLLYSGLLLSAMCAALVSGSLAVVVFCRFVEMELRFGLRNPVAQLLVNRFPRGLRVRVRAWSLGLLIPVGTLSTSLLLSQLHHRGGVFWISGLGLAAGVAYLLSSMALCRSFSEQGPIKRSGQPEDQQERISRRAA